LRCFRASGFFAFAAYRPGVFFVILPFFVPFGCFVVATLVAASGRAGISTAGKTRVSRFSPSCP
jgi:hypothetical protein